MSEEMSDEDFIQKILRETVQQSYIEATLSTIEAVSAELGVLERSF